MLTLALGVVNPLAGQEIREGLSGVVAALDRGDEDGAVRRIRQEARRSPGDPRWVRLERALEALDRPLPLGEAIPPAGLEGLGLKPVESPHLVVWCADGDSAWAEVLERVVVDFWIRWTALGVDLRPLEQRLTVVQLSGPQQYSRYLRDEGADAFLGTTGFAHPSRPLVVMFDLNRLGESAAMAAQLRGLDRRAVAIGTAAHEMVHLLVRATGLEPSPEAFPRWLHEGIAMQYEPAPGGVWLGPGSVETPRMDDWFRGSEASHRLLSLIRDEGLTQGYHPVRYAEAWSLVHYLVRDQPARFVAFLDILSVPRPEVGPDPDRFEAAFRQAFGSDLDRIQQGWRAHVRQVRREPRRDLRLPR